MISFSAKQWRPKATSFLLLLVLLFRATTTFGWVPPLPGSDLEATYEPVHEYRRRLNITYNYKPKLLHPESCRYLTEDQCQDADESMQRHAHNHQQIQRRLREERQRQRHLLEQQQQQQQQPAQPPNQDAEDTDHHHHEQKKSSRTKTAGLRARSNLNPNNNDDYDTDYHTAQFQEALGKFTREYVMGTPPTLEEELAELDLLLQERNQTLEQARRSLQALQDIEAEPETERPQAAITGRNPRVGEFNVLVLLMRFSDHTNRELPPKYEYQVLWNLRIIKWMEENSYERYTAWFEVQDWVTTDNTEIHYAFGQSGRVSEFAESYWPLLDALDEDPDWDWGRFDKDGNGLLDGLVVLHSGYGAEVGGQDCNNNRGSRDRIWSHAFSDSNGWRNKAGTYGVEGYMIGSGLRDNCGSLPPYMGILTHEYMHTFYLIDLYDYTFEGKGLGNFDIMAYPYGINNDGYIPMNLSPWAKVAVDWLECEELTESGTYTLGPAALTEDCFRITLVSKEDTGYAEYLLLENRQQALFDTLLWDSGVVIYHIDDAADEMYDRGHPGQSNWPQNNKHYMVAVLPADGQYDLEKNENNGDAGDLFLEGMTLGPNNDGSTYPNTDSYQFGKIQKSDVTIEIMEEDGMDFKIKITMPTRSGNQGAVFSAPVPDAAFFQRTPPPEAQEQFTVQDAEDLRISGKLPQLPWYQEYLEIQQQQQQSAESSANYDGEQIKLAPENSASAEEEVRSAAWTFRGRQMHMVAAALCCLTGFAML